MEYKKTAHDTLDWEDVDQLHAATLEISKTCFEFKKICVGLIGVCGALLVKLTDDRLDHSLFFVPLLLAVGFWVADATAYFYQRSLRRIMNGKLLSIAERSQIGGYSRPQIVPSWRRAFFNMSMTLYYVLCSLLILGWIAYGLGVIR